MNNEEWKNNNENLSDVKIISKESDPLRTPRTQTAIGEIKITFHRPRQGQRNGSPVNLRKLLQLKHNHTEDFNNPKTRD
jgi:hypothetical protein